MKLLLTSSALAAALFAAPALAQPPTVQSTTEGSVTIQGIEPSKVLGAIDTSKLVTEPPPADAPKAKTSVTVDTSTQQTAEAKIETRTEVIAPASDRPALDPDHPIAPEVKVAASKPRYTTADLVRAQHAAMMATPVSEPTTVIVTTTTTPNPG